jgi:hypothetical protein
MINKLLFLCCQAMPLLWYVALANKGRWPIMDSFASNAYASGIILYVILVHLLADIARFCCESWYGYKMIAILWHTGPIEGVRFGVPAAADPPQPDEEWVALIARNGKRYNFAPHDAENMRVIEQPVAVADG